jgi:hypothetical protein
MQGIGAKRDCARRDDENLATCFARCSEVFDQRCDAIERKRTPSVEEQV